MDEGITPLAASNESGTNNSGDETLIINVGGTKFETYRSTLSRIPNGPLADSTFLKEHFRNEKNDYFFDKEPSAFKVVLNYMRSGNIYIPALLDGPSLRNEFAFWGLTPDMEMAENRAPSQTHGYIGTTRHVEERGGRTNRESVGYRIWNILSNPSTSLWAKVYAGLSYFAMCLSVFILVFQTTSIFHVPLSSEANSTYEQDIRERGREDPDTYLSVNIISLVCSLLFTVEYILRVVVAPNRLRFIFSFLGVIDLLAILPLALLHIVTVGGSLRVLRILSVFRILRMLRVFEHFKNVTGTEFIVRMLISSVGELVLLFGVTAVGVLVWGTLVYYIERYHEEEEHYNMFENIPVACWWAVVTMTTVGYGDIRPLTIAGKIMGSLCAISGLLLIGLLVSVLIKNMMVLSSKMQEIETANGSDVKCQPRSV